MAEDKSPVENEGQIDAGKQDSDNTTEARTERQASQTEDQIDLEQLTGAHQSDAEASGHPRADTASLETQIEELQESVLRVQAEMMNVRKRAERDVEHAHRFAIEKFVKDLLPVLDSMDRALEIAKTTDGFDPAMLEGTEMTHKLLLDAAAKHGVEVVDPMGQPFDPNEHQAMTLVPSAEHAPNRVMAVMQKGYKLEGRVIRAAMVVVSQAGA